MDFITVPLVFAIVTLGIYKLFELFVCKKERLLIIEKLSEKFSPDMVDSKIKFPTIGGLSFSALKFGCLFMGIGLGLLVGFLIISFYTIGKVDVDSYWGHRGELIYAASVLLFGGLGLIVAFIVELKQKKNG